MHSHRQIRLSIEFSEKRETQTNQSSRLISKKGGRVTPR